MKNKNNFKKFVIKIGSVIATLLMVSPIAIISQYSRFKGMDFYFLLIVSIFYDIYMYSIISVDRNRIKEHYYNFVKDADKKLNLKVTYKEKFENLEKYVESLLEEYF